jgi:rhodanese-related sulfurtransferase
VWQLLRDLCGVLVIAIASLAFGVVMNRISSHPLPIVYQSPEQRFDAELTTLVTGSAFKNVPPATVGLDEFRAAVEARNALIFDARPSAFFEQGHVPGALNLSRDNFASDYHRLSTVLKETGDKSVLVYCSGGACHDSRLVANALLTLGFNNVSIYTGGWDEWSASGLPVVKGSAPR